MVIVLPLEGKGKGKGERERESMSCHVMSRHVTLYNTANEDDYDVERFEGHFLEKQASPV